ncbi:MAG: dihydropteroate synthase [Vampirovibrionales bacterium]|nr:dihydropteroate synthase [Vampirovibrionales bacterium]
MMALDTTDCKRPIPPIGLMAVLNVTPDSFSDGGLLASKDDLLQAAQGAICVANQHQLPLFWLDVGGESSRPGAAFVSESQELARILPAIEALTVAFPETNISIDTRRAAVAQAALRAGASIINDISAGQDDPQMFALAAKSGATLVLMHSTVVADEPQNPWPIVLGHLKQQFSKAMDAGVLARQLWLDPGFGFGKSVQQNMRMLADASPIMTLAQALGCQGVVMGSSRKSFLTQRPYQEAANALPPSQRDYLTAASLVPLIQAAIGINCPMQLRVHHVSAMADVLSLLKACEDLLF